MVEERIDSLQVRDLKVVLSKKTILDNLSFDIEKNSLTILFGKNGVGKTTLQRTLCGLLFPESGSYRINGIDSSTLRRREFAQQICYIPQSYAPPFQYSVMDFVMMGRAPHGGMLYRPSHKDMEMAAEMLERVGKLSLAARPYSELSTGEKQLVLIARGLVQDTPILLLDEPIANLDLTNQYRVMDTVRDLTRNHDKTCVVTLHDPNLSMEYADDFLLLYKGDEHGFISHKDEQYIPKATEALRRIYEHDLDIEVIRNHYFVVMH